MLDCDILSGWHRRQAERCRSRFDRGESGVYEEMKFHEEAAELVGVLSPEFRNAKVALAEIRLRGEMVAELERAWKRLSSELQQMQQMLGKDDDAS